MKKTILFLAVSAFVGMLGIGSIASADELVPGQYVQHDASVMGVGQTMMQMGAHDRNITNATNLASAAGSSRGQSGVNSDYQFGSSQSEQSWKAARTIEEAQVHGLVPGDCQGENSDGAYRKQMNDNRIDPFGVAYRAEVLVSNAQCAGYHPTLK
ncbi:uncharacterized protein METZ01_LOCUS66206 [marine metagenome]|uniref:Uncharacterized protein n=1 Tax=marine metagenome TaxID=408172 RepID=A0A381TB35_9ZZZZ